MMSELFDEEILRKQYNIAERRIAYEEGKIINGMNTVKKLLSRGFSLDDALDVAEIDKKTYEERLAVDTSSTPNHA